MSQAEEEARYGHPGTAQALVSRSKAKDEWADLRSAARWIQRKRPVVLVGLAMVAAQVTWLGQFLGHMYFFRQDFANLDLAIESPFDWRYLTHPSSGHLVIGGRAIIWGLARISFYNWGLARLVTIALVLATGLAAFQLFRTLFGERAAILIPLAIFLLAPLSVASLGWWTLTLEIVALELATFRALDAHIRYIRTGRRRHLVAATGWVFVGLLALDKGLMLPVLLFGITSAFAGGGGSWLSGARRMLARYWRAWACYAIAMAGYAVIVAVSLGRSPAQRGTPGSLGALSAFAWRLMRVTFLPGAIGGPWYWHPLPGHWYAVPSPASSALEWLAIAITMVVVAGSILRRRIAWRAWVILATWIVLADILSAVISGTAWYPVLRAVDTSYIADAVPILAICVGLAFLQVSEGTVAGAGNPAGQPVPARRRNRTTAERAFRYSVAALAAVFAIGSLRSNYAYETATTGTHSASYIANAVLAVDGAQRGTPVISGPTPTDIGYLSPTARVIGDIARGKLNWIRRPAGTIDGLRMFGPDGRLYPAWVYGASSGSSPATHSCWPARHGSIVIKFWHASPSTTIVLRIGYIWGASVPGKVDVQYGTTAMTLSVRPGLHSGFLPVAGSAASVVVSGLGGNRMCVGDVEAGLPAPVLRNEAIP